MRNEKNLMSENIAALGSWVSQGWDATKYLKLWGCDIQEIVEICRLSLSVCGILPGNATKLFVNGGGCSSLRTCIWKHLCLE